MEDRDGNSYEGDFVNYCLHGNGKFQWGNGTTFEGYFVSNSPYTGKYVFYDGTVVYLQRGERVKRIVQEKVYPVNPQIGKLQREYFDQNWNRCSAKNASYYRLITYSAPHIPQGVVKDYYISGQLQGTAKYAWIDYEDEGKNFYEGVLTTYYKSGEVASIEPLYNNERNGINWNYYANGKVSSFAFYKYGIRDGSSADYYEDGTVSRIAIYSKGQLLDNKYIHIPEDSKNIYFKSIEDFDINSDIWSYEGQNGHIIVNDERSITLSIAPNRRLIGGIYSNFTSAYDGAIHVHFSENSKNAEVGVLFGFEDWDNYCKFSIYGNRYLFKCVSKGKEIIKRTGSITKYQSGDNQISIYSDGDQLSMAINDVTEERIKRPEYDGDLVCITAYNNSNKFVQVRADNLILFEKITSEEQLYDYVPKDLLNAINEINQEDEESEGVGESQPSAVDDWRNTNWHSLGSGFFIDEKGYIATNWHVVDDARVIQATFQRNGQIEKRYVEIVAKDEKNDLAILKIKDSDFVPMPSIPYGFTTYTRDPGSAVFTLGFGEADLLGDEVKYSDGKISSKTGNLGDARMYQISVPIQHGNSGGPLFDENGTIVGIPSSGYFGGGLQLVNYAIKSSYLKALVDSMSESVKLPGESKLKTASTEDKVKQITPYMVFLLVK